MHCIASKKPEVLDDSVLAFAALTAGDVDQFGYQDAAFAADPKTVLSTALNEIGNDQQTRREYHEVLLPLVYGDEKFSFEEAWSSFGSIAKRLVNAL